MSKTRKVPLPWYHGNEGHKLKTVETIYLWKHHVLKCITAKLSIRKPGS